MRFQAATPKAVEIAVLFRRWAMLFHANMDRENSPGSASSRSAERPVARASHSNVKRGADGLPDGATKHGKRLRNNRLSS